MAKRVRTYALVDAGAVGNTAHEAPGTMAVEPLAMGAQKDRPGQTFADGQVDHAGRARCQRYRDGLSALPKDGQGAVAPLQAKGLDVGTNRLRHPGGRPAPEVR